MSDDGAWALVVIFFVGAAFSPWYARARRADPSGAAPEAHLALNAVLYGPRSAWSFTEAPAGAASRTPAVFAFQDSSASWNGRVLTVHLRAPRTPFGGAWRAPGEPIVGTVRLHAEHWFPRTWSLDPAGHHWWHPVAPVARAEVALTDPAVHFEGSAYHDANWGRRALEADFSRWSWARAARPGGARVVYEPRPRQGPAEALALEFQADGTVRRFDPGPVQDLGTTRWRLARQGRVGRPAQVRTLEDSPFYARSLVRAEGGTGLVMHESLDLDRLARPWVRFLLPFRSRRVAG